MQFSGRMGLFYHLLIASAGIVALSIAWIAVQALARRQSPEACDGPEVRLCNSCASERAERCGIRLSTADAGGSRRPDREDLGEIPHGSSSARGREE